MITFKKHELPLLEEFLGGVELYRAASRGRNRLLTLLEQKRAEVMEEEQDIMKQYAEYDEDGNVKTKRVERENGQPGVYVVFKSDEANVSFMQEMQELSLEDCSISVEEYLPLMEALLTGLDEYDKPLSGNEAYLYDLLCTQLEENLG